MYKARGPKKPDPTKMESPMLKGPNPEEEERSPIDWHPGNRSLLDPSCIWKSLEALYNKKEPLP